MMLRLLHTSDWHLGHTLHDVSREYEHECFLSWLLETIAVEGVDALIIAGDIFDVANPSAAAQQQWYGFLSKARTRFPKLDVVAVAGNHDSAARLEAPRALLEAQNMKVIGWLPRVEKCEIDFDRLIVPLHNADGKVSAQCVAVPFLRPVDLPRGLEDEDPLIAGVQQIYSQALAEALSRTGENQAIIATGHCYMSSSKLSDLSERKILGGNEHALPPDLFGDEADYVALGHLHLAQEVAGRKEVRYCGSPIPLSMSEVNYPHQVCVVNFEGKDVVDVKSVMVPRAVELLRIPADAPGEKSAVLEALRCLPDFVDEPEAASAEHPPFLEVRIKLERPESSLRREVADALEGKHVRLVKLTVETTGSGESLRGATPQKQLHDLNPEDVFAQLYASKHESDLPDELMSCFREMIEEVQAGVSR